LEFLKSTGICTWQSMPFTSTDCSLLPNSSQLTEAANYKITSYSSIYTSDLPAIKNSLVNKHPLIAAFTVDNSFFGAGPGFIWKTYSNTNGPFHCVAICGYDDSKHAVKIMNSWGTTWGEAGFSWIDYDFLATITSKVYLMSL
jgi:C1A family cysteine protease